jgi:hypothetical protein
MTNLMFPTVSGLTAGVLLFLQIVLMLAAARLRGNTQTAIGEGTDPALLRAVRRHGNLAENAGIFVVALALAEMMGSARWLICAAAAVFVVARIIHAIGLSMANTVNIWRILGVVGTAFAGLAIGVRLILLTIGHL